MEIRIKNDYKLIHILKDKKYSYSYAKIESIILFNSIKGSSLYK